MNDMRDLENGFRREPLGVGAGDWLPNDDPVPRCQSCGSAVDLDDPLLIKWAED